MIKKTLLIFITLFSIGCSSDKNSVLNSEEVNIRNPVEIYAVGKIILIVEIMN